MTERPRGTEVVAEEQREDVAMRLEALADARASGTVGVTGRILGTPAPGLIGEQVVNRAGNDWEPALAADPNASYVYVLHNRYGGTPACARDCPTRR